MVVLVILVCTLLGISVLWDVIGMCVVGFPKSDKEISDLIGKLKNNQPDETVYGNDEWFKNSISPMYQSKILDETMIYTFQKPFISKAIKGVTFGWYIDGVGAVPRWYKSHCEIDNWYKELKNR